MSLKTSYQLSVKEADIRLLLSNQLSHLDSIAVSVFVQNLRRAGLSSQKTTVLQSIVVIPAIAVIKKVVISHCKLIVPRLRVDVHSSHT